MMYVCPSCGGCATLDDEGFVQPHSAGACSAVPLRWRLEGASFVRPWRGIESGRVARAPAVLWTAEGEQSWE